MVTIAADDTRAEPSGRSSTPTLDLDYDNFAAVYRLRKNVSTIHLVSSESVNNIEQL